MKIETTDKIKGLAGLFGYEPKKKWVAVEEILVFCNDSARDPAGTLALLLAELRKQEGRFDET